MRHLREGFQQQLEEARTLATESKQAAAAAAGSVGQWRNRWGVGCPVAEMVQIHKEIHVGVQSKIPGERGCLVAGGVGLDSQPQGRKMSQHASLGWCPHKLDGDGLLSSQAVRTAFLRALHSWQSLPFMVD